VVINQFENVRYLDPKIVITEIVVASQKFEEKNIIIGAE
jgi:hypothetical protein